ncbi:uncharacterized protein LOC142335916 [Convolutriloba macropyga]|uniref:uncharacterized protein LOC142335916 n=1 Tax=Convolutriloba macropyga TaxID=536237 RepID=UPI003F5217CA
MLELFKTQNARDHYLQFAKLISRLILQNHLLSSHTQEDENDDRDPDSIAICEQILQLAQTVCDFAREIASRLDDKTLKMSLTHTAYAVLDNCRNLLFSAQQKNTVVKNDYAIDQRETFIQSCHSTQHECLKLIVSIERAEEEKIVRSGEWCMDRLVILETVQDSHQFQTEFQNFSEAYELFVNLVASRIDVMIDPAGKVKLQQSVETYNQSLNMLELALTESFREAATTENPNANEGKVIAVNRSLQKLGNVLEVLEETPDVDKILQKECHYYTVMQQMIEVLQPEKRFDKLGNMSIDAEVALRHVMMLAFSAKDEETNEKLLRLSQKLLQNVNMLNELNPTATNSPQESQNEREDFTLECNNTISTLTALDSIVREVTVQNVFEAFIDFSNPSQRLQDLAGSLSMSPGLTEEECVGEIQSTLDEFRHVNKEVAHVTSLALAAYPFSNGSKKLSESLVSLQNCALQFESEAFSHSLSPANASAVAEVTSRGQQGSNEHKSTIQSSSAGLSLCRRNWELHVVRVKSYLYDLIGREVVVTQAVNALSRDFEILKHEGMKRLISDTSDEVVSRLLRRLSGLCLVSNEIVDASCDAIYRNGLLALANQIAKAASALDQSYRLCTNTKQDRSQPIPNLKYFCEQLIDKTHLAEECVNRLVLGLTRARQPGILNPIRRNIRGQKDDEVKSPEDYLTPFSSYLHSIKPSLLTDPESSDVFGQNQRKTGPTQKKGLFSSRPIKYGGDI